MTLDDANSVSLCPQLSAMLMLVAALLLLAAATCEAQNPEPASADFINIADRDIVFDDRSALANEANLHSEQYSAFIHQLYHFDTDNLQKFDSLYGQHQQAAL